MITILKLITLLIILTILPAMAISQSEIKETSENIVIDNSQQKINLPPGLNNAKIVTQGGNENLPPDMRNIGLQNNSNNTIDPNNTSLPDDLHAINKPLKTHSQQSDTEEESNSNSIIKILWIIMGVIAVLLILILIVYIVNKKR